jgi:hypothetical protein
MLMHSLTRIRAAGYSIMLASVGVFSMPPTVHAQGDASPGTKRAWTNTSRGPASSSAERGWSTSCRTKKTGRTLSPI